MTSLPVIQDVCSLDDPALETRLAMIRREIAPHVVRSDHAPSHLVWHFDTTPDLHDRLERLVALERECCSRFDYAIHTDTGLRLEIRGDGAEALQRAVAMPAPPRSRWRRAIGACGAGALGSFLVLCVLPLGVAAIAGPAIGAGLENPASLTALALLLGAATWGWLERRRRTDR